jgi:CheY-like chemotaxis protein
LEKLRDIPEIKKTPVVFMTSKIMPNQLEQYQPLGVIGIINKPLNPMRVSEQVIKIWNDE